MRAKGRLFEGKVVVSTVELSSLALFEGLSATDVAKCVARFQQREFYAGEARPLPRLWPSVGDRPDQAGRRRRPLDVARQTA